MSENAKNKKKLCQFKIFDISFLVSVLTFIYLFYYSYRYIFKFNSVDTSPTYSNTPYPFQIAKYIFVIVITFLMLIPFLKGKFTFSLYSFLFLIIIVQELYAFIITKSNNTITFITCSIPAFMLLISSKDINLDYIEAVFKGFLYFTIVYEIIQIGLYITIKRLPALGYNTGEITDVRFGGAWDDPNGFSVLLGFYIPYVLKKYNGIKKLIITGTLLLFLVLTWSLTGLFSIFFVSFLYVVFRFICKNRVKTIYIVIFFLILFLILLFVFIVDSSSFKNYISKKAESIIIHLNGWSLNGISLKTFLGFAPQELIVEISIIRLLGFAGIIHVLFFLIFAVKSMINYYHIIYNNQNSKFIPLYCASLFYIATMTVSLFNLPLSYSFANFGIFILLCSLSFKIKRQF